MQPQLSYRRRVITDDDLGFIRQLIAANPQSGRRNRSEKLCLAWNWMQANGALRSMVCRGLMLMLHRRGLIELPPVRRVLRNPMVDRTAPEAVTVNQTPLRSTLAELGALEICQVRRTPDEAVFNALMQQHHYLGYTRPVGEHLKVMVYAAGRPVRGHGVELRAPPPGLPRPVHRLDGAGAFGQHRPAGLQHPLPDPALGDGAASGVAPAGSHGPALVGRLASAVCPPIQFLETFIDPERFRGTCCRAANWTVLGITTGRGKDAPTRPSQSLDQAGAGLRLGGDLRQRLARLAA